MYGSSGEFWSKVIGGLGKVDVDWCFDVWRV